MTTVVELEQQFNEFLKKKIQFIMIVQLFIKL